MKWLAPLIIVVILVILGFSFCSKAPEAKTEASTYEIKVYDFNRDTGIGYAYLKTSNNDDKPLSVRLMVEKYDAKNQAKTFTGSENDDAFIKVKGKVTEQSGQPMSLTVVPEESEAK